MRDLPLLQRDLVTDYIQVTDEEAIDAVFSEAADVFRPVHVHKLVVYDNGTLT